MGDNTAHEASAKMGVDANPTRGIARTTLIAIVVGLLLTTIPIIMSLNAGADDAPTDIPQPTENELANVELIIGHFANARIDEAENAYSGTVDPQRLPAEVYERLLGALLVSQSREFTKTGLFLYGRMLTDIARYGVVFDPLAFRSHVRRLRHQAISRGEVEDLYFAVIYRLMEYPGLVDYCSIMRVDLLDFHVLFGDHTPAVADESISDRSHWDRALDHLPILIEQQRVDPSSNLDERYHPLRTLARVYARFPTDRARAMFKETLGKLGDGSEADAERFNRWFARAVRNPDEELWVGPSDPTECFGYDAEIAMQLRNWLFGVSRYYRPGDGLTRGRQWIERTVASVDFGPHYLFKLDLALAIRDETNRLEAVLRDRSSVSGKDRIRQLYEIGWESVRRGDRHELRSVLTRLEDSSVREVEHLRELLRGALHLMRGEPSMGLRRIGARLDGEYETLSSDEVAQWRKIYETEQLPAAPDDQVGHSLLTSGVLWDDLREEKQLERVVAQLERNLSSSDDLYYMQYLEAALAYRRSDVDGLAERMRALLDLAEPPGIGRSDVAGLAANVDSRVEDIETIRERRRRALEELIPEVVRGVPDSSSVIQSAEIVDWQIRMDRSKGRYLDTEDGRRGLRSIMEDMTTDRGLDARIEEKWIELESELLGFSRQLREEGQLQLARQTLAYSNLLGVDHPSYRAEEAQILALEAEQVAYAEPERRAEAWRLVGEAYRDAASTQFGDTRHYFDAGRAFLAAEEFVEAKKMFDKFVPNRGAGARAEQRYWWRIIHTSEVARKSGVPALALKTLDEITDFHGAETYWSRLELERAWALDDSGKGAEALEIFERVLLSLVDPLSEDYAHALYGKARVLQEMHGRLYGDPSRSAEETTKVLDESQQVWENLCHKLRKDSGDVRLAEALYLAGVGWIEREDYSRARGYFEQVVPAYEYAKSVDLPPADLQLWQYFAVKAAHAHAEAFFLENRYADAIKMYEAAIATDPNSGEIALAHHQVGLSWFQLNDFIEAKRHWQLGRSRVEVLDDASIAELPINQDKDFWLALYDEKLEALDNPDRLRRP